MHDDDKQVLGGLASLFLFPSETSSKPGYGLFFSDKRIVGLSYSGVFDAFARATLLLIAGWVLSFGGTAVYLYTLRPSEIPWLPVVAGLYPGFLLAWLLGLGYWTTDRILSGKGQAWASGLSQENKDFEVRVDEIQNLELLESKTGTRARRLFRIVPRTGQVVELMCGEKQFKEVRRLAETLCSRVLSIRLATSSE